MACSRIRAWSGMARVLSGADSMLRSFTPLTMALSLAVAVAVGGEGVLVGGPIGGHFGGLLGGMAFADTTVSATAPARAEPATTGSATTGSATTGSASVTDPSALVASMSRALRELNYEGTFVHLQGMHVSSMQILHANDGGSELERMVSLDGEAREVIRDNTLVTCIWPGSQSVVISKSKPRRLLPDVDASLANNASYRITLAGNDRVAGRATQVVEIRSRDSHRYGYRFWVDKETRMLLRSMLLDGEKSVEQVLFTAIAYPEVIDRSRFEIDDDDERISWFEPERARATAGDIPRLATDDQAVDPGVGARQTTFVDRQSGSNGQSAADVDRVRFAVLPAGYTELSESYRTLPDEPPVSHVMVSDGMASISIYVEHVAQAKQDRRIEGMSSMGAMNAFGLSLPEAFVTVVGEVPGATVQAIAEAVRLIE